MNVLDLVEDSPDLGARGNGQENSDPRRKQAANARSEYTQRMRSHLWIDSRSLALHNAVAAKLERQPDLVDVARSNLRRWLSAGGGEALREWMIVLETESFQDLLALLRNPSERGTRLRQSSPFAGILTPAERQAILDEYESRCA